MIVIIPSYNPDHHLEEVLNTFHSQTDYKVILVDDGSNEQCKENFKGLTEDDILLVHEVNRGKGAAMKTSLSYILENKIEDEGVVFVDSDGQHKIADVQNVVEALRENPDAIVLGSRTFHGEIPWKSKVGNEATKFFFLCLTGKKVKDTQTGLRAFPMKYVEKLLEIPGDRYEYEMNVLTRLAKEKYTIVEIPIQTVYENNENKTTHFRPIADSIRIYSVLFKFLFSSIASAVVDYTLFFLLVFLCGNPEDGLIVVICNVLARVVSACFNYSINRKYVFDSKARALSSGLKYAALCIGILCFNSVCMYIFTEFLSFPVVATKFIVEAVAFVVSFLVQQRKIF